MEYVFFFFWNVIEKKLFKKMTVANYVSRLLQCRPLVFFTGADSFLLKNGRSGCGWSSSSSVLPLEEYLTYEEMQISALLGVSVPTHFINSGKRSNMGNPDRSGAFQATGVYVGLVGARFEVPNKMESQHLLVTENFSTPERGYGNFPHSKSPLFDIWSQFYKIPYFPEFSEVVNNPKYLKISSKEYLNIEAYKRRIQVVAEPFILEANQRGMESNKQVYTHIVGLGLGVWMVSGAQSQYMIEVYANIMDNFDLPNVSVIDFSWFDANSADVFARNFKKLRNEHIQVKFSKRDPADKLQDPNQLLVAMYAWDGNSYPGNEYWKGMLAASGDPAAACCSTIPYLQNPDINPNVSGEAAITFPGGNKLA